MKRMFFTLLLPASLILNQVQAQQPTPLQKTVHVQAVAEMEIVPDEVYVQVHLQEYDKKGSGKVDINSIKNEFLNRMKKLGLTEKEVTVQNYSGYDGNNWWWRKNKKRNPDLKASVQYLLKLNSVKQIDEVVKNLDDEATENFYIQKLTHSRIEEYKKQLKIQALKDAKEKAGFLAEALGAQLGDVLQINEPNEIVYGPYPMRETMNMRMAKSEQAADEPALDVDFKKIKIKMEAPISFLLK